MPAIECVSSICQPIQGNVKYDILVEKSFQDITIDNGIRKNRVSGEVKYNELTNGLY